MISENKDEKVRLAHAPPFSVGAVKVRPATREVLTESGRVVLEPRVMQVLVALARANGEVVTRDDLIAACWEGRVVSEDAINRVISKLRGLAEGAAAGAFTIETITKVGYRLTAADGLAPPQTTAAAPAKPKVDRRLLIAGGAVSAIAAPALIWSQRRPAVPARAQELHLKAVATFGSSDPVQRAEAVAMLREAVSLAPDYADAWADLAVAYELALFSSPPERHQQLTAGAKDAAARAIALDPGSPEAHGALALLAPLHGNWVEAEEGYRAALARRPRHAAMDQALGLLLGCVGRIRECLPFAIRSQAALPLTPGRNYQLAFSYWYAGRLEDALRTIDKAYALSPLSAELFFGRVQILMYSGRAREALDMLEDNTRWPRGIPAGEFDLVRLVAKALDTGNSRDRAEAIAKNMAAARKGTGYAYNTSNYAAGLGDVDAALEAASAYFFNRPFKIANAHFTAERGMYALIGERLTEFLFSPPFKTARADRRFEDLVAEIGLEAYWRETGSSPDYRRGL
jgi:DNA-binding winged helix-turn-helix (wHTH) protein/tetratricopeptide (TPR) repeat protein